MTTPNTPPRGETGLALVLASISLEIQAELTVYPHWPGGSADARVKTTYSNPPSVERHSWLNREESLVQGGFVLPTAPVLRMRD